MAREPVEMRGVCLIGAIYAPSGGHVSSYTVRNRVQPDPTNFLPATFFHLARQNDLSQRLVSAPQGAGGVMPVANRYLGAPMQTFVYGGIAPGEAHPQLTLIQGPQTNYEFTPGVVYGYNPTFSQPDPSLAGTQGTGVDAPDFSDSADPDSLEQRRPQFPTIPSVLGAYPFPSDTTVLPTYNIWDLQNMGDSSTGITYKKGLGPQYPNGYQGARLLQQVSPSGVCSLQVTAQNVSATVSRLFPIASDLAYAPGAQIYFPAPGSGITVPPEPTNMTGGANCGFQLHFHHAPLSQMSNKNSQTKDPGIRVFWGESTSDRTTISSFKLVLLPGEPPALYYDHPVNGWDNPPVRLKGPDFGSGFYSLYVHYAGPYMYIGYNANPETWDCFMPPDYNNGERVFPILAPATSPISLRFDNITASFIYGPIAFNSYHPENIQTQADVTNQLHRGTVNIQFNAPNQPQYQDESAINALFQQSVYDITQLSPLNNGSGMPTAYTDWRQPTGAMSFKLDSSVLTSLGDALVSGRLIMNTAMAGHQFMELRSARPELGFGSGPGVGTTPASTLVQQMPWGDLSDYMTEWEVTDSWEGETAAFKKSNARITLADLDISQKGRRIITLLEGEGLVVTVGAGESAPESYFQGVIKKVIRTSGPTGTRIVLECQDVISQMLENTYFETHFSFAGLTYGDIIAHTLAMGGVYSWYVQAQDADLVSALSNRLNLLRYQGSLANEVLMANPTMPLMDIIRPTLAAVINYDGALPVLYWDISTGRVRLDWKQNPEFVETLQFLGEIDTSNLVYLPEDIHGVLKNEYTVTTQNQELHAGLVLYGKNYYGNTLTYYNFFPEAFSKASLAQLSSAIEGDTGGTTAVPQLGYVGFRKYFKDAYHMGILPDWVSLKNYGDDMSVKYLRRAYQSLDFDCYVTRPLNPAGQFTIATFIGGEKTQSSDYWMYKRVSYTWKKKANTVEASIQGMQFPLLTRPNS